jgi:hypothetical protein
MRRCSPLKERYNFEPTEEWLEHLQESSMWSNSCGSGSFVSPDGLVMTDDRRRPRLGQSLHAEELEIQEKN